MLSVAFDLLLLLNVDMLIVIMLNVVMLSVAILNAVIYTECCGAPGPCPRPLPPAPLVLFLIIKTECFKAFGNIATSIEAKGIENKCILSKFYLHIRFYNVILSTFFDWMWHVSFLNNNWNVKLESDMFQVVRASVRIRVNQLHISATSSLYF